jgi:tRNA uridine 5-carboxymethylaminomethyl modification enzyme
MSYISNEYDICVIGAGHAGIEAALAAARLGAKTVCFTVSLDATGNMPCNPSIGGTAKGCLVREIDALGGEMGRAADATCIQFRLLNRGKGPAVQSPRAQADRRAYQSYMKRTLENQELLELKQGEVTKILAENGEVCAVRTALGAEYKVKCVIIASGTYLGGKVIIGSYSKNSGPDGMFPANELTRCLRDELGISIRRFKTGTPPRVNARSLDYSRMQAQYGEDDLAPFSFSADSLPENRAVCYLTYTNERTHEVIRNNLHRSPLFSGEIVGVGPRYCPSIEDKVVRFADKQRHQVFVEPMGLDTGEMYLQGLSSSLPEEVQTELVRTIAGLENAEFMRSAYAIEYDCVDPLELICTLEHKKISGLFGAGQYCGTSGYEEAAALGLVAGINAARKVKGLEPLSLDRATSYIGTLIDDLVTKGTNEPYRMMTSRSEYRLILRQDNADMRLTKIGYDAGLVRLASLKKMTDKYASVDMEIERLKNVSCKADELTNSILLKAGTSPIETGMRMYELLKRPQISYEDTSPIDPERPLLSRAVREQINIQIKYDGYIKRQESQINDFRRQESRKLPPNIAYDDIAGIRIEARQKLAAVRPSSIGQAGRISGVNPSDITALIIYLDQLSKGARDDAT